MRPRLSYANVMATIAVFLAVAGGSAYALKLGKGSVKTKTIKNGAVTEAKLRNGAVTRKKVKLASLGLHIAPEKRGFNPDSGQTLSGTLLDVHGTKLIARCHDDGAGRDASIEASVGSSGVFRGLAGLDPSEDPAPFQLAVPLSGTPATVVQELDETGESSVTAQGTLTSNAGPALAVQLYAATNSEGTDCQFMAKAIGG